MALQSVYMLAPVAYVQVSLPEQTNTDSRKSMPFCNQNGIFRCLMLSFRLFIKKVGRIIVYQNISAKYFSKPQLNSYTEKALLSQIESKAFFAYRDYLSQSSTEFCSVNISNIYSLYFTADSLWHFVNKFNMLNMLI